jgi:predicted RNA binding protein YcfA (HicA-like mRNA interferase family)
VCQEFRHADGRSTTVPFHANRDIAPTLIRQIARDIGMQPDEFIASRS